MITFACEQCGKTLRVGDEAAGKRARCPGCAHRSAVPPTAGPADTRGDGAPTSEQATLGPAGGGGPGGRKAVAVPGYEVLGELGRGGMGVVYKARQLRPRRLVALKMVLAGEHAGADALARFRAEAEAVARLQHPNIVAVHEVGEHGGRPYFSLEYVEGGSLAERLEGGALTARQAAQLIHDVARGVHFAHRRGVVHRDLKPGNILLAPPEEGEGEEGRPRWQPKVADFGLAKQLDGVGSAAVAGPRTASGAVLGTPAYMAPEQAAGKRKVGPAADVYALGAILYHCLAGRPPFEGGSMLDTLMMVASDEPVPVRRHNAGVPRDLETVCHRCLEKEPSRRYASARELADDLRRYLDGEPVKARPLGALGRLGRWLRKRREVAYVAAGLLLAALVVGGASFWLLSPPGREDGPEDRAAVPTPPGDPIGGPADDPGSVSDLRLRAARMSSSNNLKQIGVAFHNLAAAYGTLPPAAICDPKTGKALLSWRVAILPYIEQDNLYRLFRPNEAWDGPNNKKLAEMMPKVFESPEGGAPKGHTYYQVFTGPGTPFDESRLQLGGPFGRQGPRMPASFTDGTSNTILVVEAGKAVPWTKPEDVAYDPKKPIPALGGPYKPSYLVAMADGSVRNVSRTLSEATLRAAITPSGGEVPGNDWPNGTETRPAPGDQKAPGSDPPSRAPGPGESKGQMKKDPLPPRQQP